ncbi:MAG: hypothetical protein ABSA97_15550 [Verrucomicrobiia bacterium]|jgi:hypothetical protein
MSLTFITTCAHCPQKFTTPGFGDLLPTESGRVKIGNVFQALIGHLQKRHPQEAQKADLSAAMLGGLLRLMNFHSDDPVALQMREWNRHVIHEMTRAVVCPDNKIEEQVAALGLNEYTALRVTTLLKQMRDVIEERGAFAPPDPASASNGKPSAGPMLVLP